MEADREGTCRKPTGLIIRSLVYLSEIHLVSCSENSCYVKELRVLDMHQNIRWCLTLT